MTNEQAKSISNAALDKLMDALERGQSDALKNYLAVMARFHKYSFGNSLLIYTRKPDATHVAGFHAWLKLQRHVRKGEKGMMILAPMVDRKKSSEDDLAEDSGTRLYGFRAAYVFDLSQTDGEPLAEFAKVTGDPGEFLDKLKSFVTGQGIVLEYSDSIRPAMGCSYGGRIALQPGLAPAEHFSTLVHEAAHELLHRGERRSQTNHVIRETEAEAVAYVVNSAVGLELSTASMDYIKLHAGDREALAESLALVQRDGPDHPHCNPAAGINDDTRGRLEEYRQCLLDRARHESSPLCWYSQFFKLSELKPDSAEQDLTVLGLRVSGSSRTRMRFSI